MVAAKGLPGSPDSVDGGPVRWMLLRRRGGCREGGLSASSVQPRRQGCPGLPICGFLLEATGSGGTRGEQHGSLRWTALATAGFLRASSWPSLRVLCRELITLAWAQDLLGHLAVQLEDPSGWQIIFLSGISHQEQRKDRSYGDGLKWGRHHVGALGPKRIVALCWSAVQMCLGVP